MLAKALRDDFFTPPLGEVAEWPNVTDSKSVVPERVPGVRIPPSPPFKGHMRVLNLCQLVRDGDINCDILT